MLASENRAEELNDGVPDNMQRHITLLAASIQASNKGGPYMSNVEIASSDTTGVIDDVRRQIALILDNAV